MIGSCYVFFADIYDQTVPLVTGNRYVIKNGTLTHVESRHSKLLWSPTVTETKQLYLYVFTDLMLITKKRKYAIIQSTE